MMRDSSLVTHQLKCLCYAYRICIHIMRKWNEAKDKPYRFERGKLALSLPYRWHHACKPLPDGSVWTRYEGIRDLAWDTTLGSTLASRQVVGFSKECLEGWLLAAGTGEP